MSFFFFNDTATTEIYTLSLHDALPIWRRAAAAPRRSPPGPGRGCGGRRRTAGWGSRRAASPGGTAAAATGSPTDRKSTRLNSSHANISYAVFCLKKKKKIEHHILNTLQ